MTEFEFQLQRGRSNLGHGLRTAMRVEPANFVADFSLGNSSQQEPKTVFVVEIEITGIHPSNHSTTDCCRDVVGVKFGSVRR